MTKICTKCKEEKDISYFHTNKSTKIGLVAMCKSCACARTRSYYHKKIFEPIVDLEGEVWNEIKEFEGMYQISNLGRFSSMQKEVNCRGGVTIVSKRILKPEITRLGYLRVCLQKYGHRKKKLLHVLVAQHFIPNPLNLPEVNHLKGNKKDCRWFMLEWSNRSLNQKHAFATGLKKPKIGKDNPASKRVLNTQNGVYYNSAKEAAESSDIKSEKLRAMLSGIQKNKSPFIYA